MTLIHYIKLASGLLATTYGHGEMMCGPIDKPQACIYGAITSNGSTFDPDKATAAIAAPSTLRIPPSGVRVHLRIISRDAHGRLSFSGPCKLILITDKMNERWIGVRGWDLTPGAVRYLGGTASPMWSATLELCKPEKLVRDPVFDKLLPVERVLS